MTNVLIYSYLGYLVLFLTALIAHVWWRRRQRKAKLPFDAKTERVMRTPGEGARKKIDLLSDEILENMFAAFFAPVVVLFVYQLAIFFLQPTGIVLKGVLIALPVTCLIVLGVFVWRITKSVLDRSNWYLGHYGERNVADNLDPLRNHGWRVFHDVPAERKGKKFNIDHVAVGPAGVFAIETKTPRQPETPKPGKQAHVVQYNGRWLRWPTGVIDELKPQMAKSRAQWLHDWLGEKKITVPWVAPILAIPWWYVRNADDKGDYPIPAVNPGQLVGLLTSKPRTLSDAQVVKVSDALRLHCCDVEF